MDSAEQLERKLLLREVADLKARIESHPFKAYPTNESRDLDTVFQIGASTPTLVIYTIELEVTFTLVTTQTILVELLSDANNPPITSQGSVYLEGDQGLGLSVTTTIKQRQMLIALIQPGNYVKLASSGTGTATLINRLELVLG